MLRSGLLRRAATDCGHLRHALAALLLVAGSNAFAGEGGRGPHGRGGGSWPQFHGTRRDNISREAGLLKQWPEGGPRLLWKFPGCGRGYSGVAVADGTIYTVGDFGDDELLLALDLDGSLKWKARNGRSWRRSYPGSRTTPTCVDNRVYHLNGVGRLAAFDAKSGKEVWAVDLVEAFGARYGVWGMAENIVVDGDLVLCVPGGGRGRLAALDRRTGDTVWVNTEVADGVAYSSPAVGEHAGARQLVALMKRSVVGVDVASGKLLWSHPHVPKYDQNVTMPILHDGRVFVCSGHGSGGRLVRIPHDGKGAAEEWLNKDIDNCHGGVILLGGCLYGSGCRLYKKGFVCVDFRTGETLWSHKALGKVSITYADGLFYCLSDKGRMSLVDADREGCRVVSGFSIPKEGKGLSLSHPVVCGGRLYVRYGGNLFAYDVRAADRQ